MDIARVKILDEDKLESKHDVRAYKVLEVMRNKPRIRFGERGRGKDEAALVISARDMDQQVRKRYVRK